MADNPITRDQAAVALAEAGSQRAAARLLGCKQHHIRLALDCHSKPYNGPSKDEAAKLLSESRVAAQMNKPGRYLLTSAQGGVGVHQGFLDNLEAYAAYLGATIQVAPVVYDTREERNTKQGSGAGDPYTWDKAIEPYLVERPQRYGRAKFEFTASLNVRPTAVNPLTGIVFPPRISSVIPHQKIAATSAPSYSGHSVQRYTTGSVTKPRHIQRKAGQSAEFHHSIGAVVLEVAKDGSWWVRHITAAANGSFHDLTRYVDKGEIREGIRVSALVMGDLHYAQRDEAVYEMTCLKSKSMMSELVPRWLVLHDAYDGAAINPHADWAEMMRVRLGVAKSATDEVKELSSAFAKLEQKHKNTRFAVVSSNHDDFLRRWVGTGDWKHMGKDMELYLDLAGKAVRAIRAGKEIGYLDEAMRIVGFKGKRFRFLAEDEEFSLHKVNLAMHGHRGINGSRGSSAGLRHVAEKSIIGHSHVAGINEGVVQVGTTSKLRLGYNKGPSSWSNTHALLYRDGKRTLITFWHKNNNADWRMR